MRKPNSGMRHTDMSTAPAVSMAKVPMRAWRTTRTTPSMSLRLRVDTMISRSDRPIRRWRAKETRVMTVMKPRPPNWIMVRMTA